nr:MAG TPA: hypothetical protein [Caudoviricetes sp.]
MKYFTTYKTSKESDDIGVHKKRLTIEVLL